MKLLLDTNAYSALMQGKLSAVETIRSSESILMSPFVMGELLFGFRNGNRYEDNIKQLKSFMEKPFVEKLSVGMTTADRYSRIAAQLRKKGHPIPTNDIWIAAHALEKGADLLTYDKHFKEVEGLALIYLQQE